MLPSFSLSFIIHILIFFSLPRLVSFPQVTERSGFLKRYLIFNRIVKTATEVRSLKRSKIGSTLH